MQTKDCQWKKSGCWSLFVHNKKNVEIIEKKAQKVRHTIGKCVIFNNITSCPD